MFLQDCGLACFLDDLCGSASDPNVLLVRNPVSGCSGEHQILHSEPFFVWNLTVGNPSPECRVSRAR